MPTAVAGAKNTSQVKVKKEHAWRGNEDTKPYVAVAIRVL